MGRRGPAAAVEKAFAHAPPNAYGVAHADIQAQRVAMRDGLRAIREKYGDEEGVLAFLTQYEAALRKVRTTDAFFQGWPADSIIVARGELTPEDVAAVLAALPDDAALLTSGENGRYELRFGGEAVRLIFGRPADGVPSGVVLVGPHALLTPGFVARMGRHERPEFQRNLAGLLTPDDVASDAWVAAILPAGQARVDVPRTVAGRFGVHDRGAISVRLGFATEDAAQAAHEGASGLDFLSGLVTTQRQGKQVILQRAPGKGSLFEDLLAAMIRAKREAARVASKANLRNLAACVAMHQAEWGGQWPTDLAALVERYELPASALVSPLRGRQPGTDEADLPQGASDYVYVRYPGRSLPPRDLILFYERPENYNNEGTCVALVDGKVTYLPFEEFRRRLQRSQTWAEANRAERRPGRSLRGRPRGRAGQ